MIIAYNVRAVSVLGYVLQFHRPTQHLLKLEDRAMQILHAGPRNSFSSGMLKSLKPTGCNTQCVILSRVSQAAACRTAQDSKAWQRYQCALGNVLDISNELIPQRLLVGWYKTPS